MTTKTEGGLKVMAVVIQNMGEVQGKPGIFGYDIRINRDLVTRCVHKRDDGLAALLRLAADAVDRKVFENLKRAGEVGAAGREAGEKGPPA